MKESVRSKFDFDDNYDGEVVRKKIAFDFDSLIGNLKNIIVFVVTVLVCMQKLASGATPFGMAMLVAISTCNIPLIIPWALISIVSGIAFGKLAVIKFVIASLFYVLLKSFIKNENTKFGNVCRLIFAVAVSEIIGLAINGVLLYDALLGVYNTITTTIFYLIFAEGLPVVFNLNKGVYSTEQVAAGGVLLTVVLSFFSGFSIFGMTVSKIISVLIVMSLGWRRGAMLGASSGISIAIMLSLLGNGEISLVAMYGLSGLVSGFLSRFGKVGVIVGFIFGNIILAFCANGSVELLNNLKEVIFASVLLLFLPRRVSIIIDDLFDYSNALEGAKECYIEESTIYKLDAACETVEDMAQNVYKKDENEETISDAMGSFIKTLNDNTCKRCENYEKCWVNNYHKMYETTFDAINLLQNKGEIASSDLNDTCCNNKLLLADGINLSYEIYKVNQEWQQKMEENKKHISRQLKEVSSALNKMKNEMKEVVVPGEKTNAKYSLEIGISRKKKNNSIISGDSTTIIKLKDGKILVGLSDGMGSGEVAARNSKKVMLVLEKFLNTGFDKETAIKLLNSYLLIGKDEDNFATLDVAIFDPNTCEVEFIKVSACPTLLKIAGKYKQIDSISLPIGIIDDIDVDLKTERLCKGDIFVMTTDGIIDVSSKLPEEKNLEHLLKELKTEDSQRMSEIVLQEMLDATYGIAKDDMTVMVVKVV